MKRKISEDSVASSSSEQQEARLLCHLCTGSHDEIKRLKIIDALKTYRFTTVHHQVLFDSLKSVPSGRPELAESLLPARLVRAGFPDFDLEPFLQPSDLSATQALALARALTAKS